MTLVNILEKHIDGHKASDITVATATQSGEELEKDFNQHMKNHGTYRKIISLRKILVSIYIGV